MTPIPTPPSDPMTAPLFFLFCGTSAIFPISSVLTSPATKLPPNLNYGTTGRPVNPLASTPSPCPRAASLEVTESFKLDFSSSSGIPTSQGEGVEGRGWSHEYVALGVGRFSSQLVLTGHKFVSSSPSVPASL